MEAAGETTGRPIPTITPLLEVRELVKSFGAVRAARGVNFEVRAGEVLALLGDNGAGKSTVVKCISGTIQPDSGSIYIDGHQVNIDSPQKARHLGIETVYQDLAIVESLNVTTNMFLNRELLRRPPLRWAGWMDRKRMHRETRAILDRLHIRIPSVRQKMYELSGGQRQAVAVGRTVAWGRHIVLLDEPAAALGVEQTQLVLSLIKRLRSEGIAIVLISHNMHDVLEVCDRAVVLRHGMKVADVDDISGVSPRHLVDLITGVNLGSGDVRHSDEPN
jgi:simple sugar transport system ATP-binding protein